MTASAHIVTGAAIWLATRNPYIAIPLCFFSHQVLDLWCLYHPDKLLLLDSWGKRILFAGNVLTLVVLFILTRNFTAWFYGIGIAWLGFDLQWILRWMGKKVYATFHYTPHDWFGRRFEFESTLKVFLFEAFVMVYGLFLIWRL